MRPFVFAVLLSSLACGTSPSVVDAGSVSVDGGVALEPPGTHVTIDSGPLVGTAEGANYVFKGIPYAAPPIGDLRWKGPIAVLPWTAARDATTFGDRCAQVDLDGHRIGSEDCLFVNVWTPQTRSTSTLPVLFWIHGGGNAGGSSNDYDGAAWAQTANVVVVSINYRLGPLGWFSEAAFASEDARGAVGNYGLRDQLAALEWVKRNIASFGGDPTRVLLFGESAGGIDSCALMTSPLAAGLFSSVIAESGACYSLDATTSAGSASAFVQAVGCNGAANVVQCLRAVPLATVLAHANGAILFGIDGNIFGSQYIPSEDGYLLPLRPERALERGQFNKVPYLVGTNANETSDLSFLPTPIQSDADYLADLEAAFGMARGQTVYGRYPSSSYPSPSAAFAAVISDYLADCPTRRQLRAVVANHPRVWRYHYTHTLDGPPHTLPLHGYEVLPLWSAWSFLDGYTPSAGEAALTKSMQAHWVAMAANGDPQVAGDVTWPSYDAATDPFVVIDETQSTGQGLRTSACDFMDTFDTR